MATSQGGTPPQTTLEDPQGAFASQPLKALLQRFRQNTPLITTPDEAEANDDWRRIVAHTKGTPAQKVEHLTTLAAAGFDAPTYHRQALNSLLAALKAENATLKAAQHHEL